MENNNILLFKTNILTAGDVSVLQHTLNLHPQIKKWTIDLDDDERILRIVSSELDHGHVIEMIKLNGYHCEELKD